MTEAERGRAVQFFMRIFERDHGGSLTPKQRYDYHNAILLFLSELEHVPLKPKKDMVFTKQGGLLNPDKTPRRYVVTKVQDGRVWYRTIKGKRSRHTTIADFGYWAEQVTR